MIKRRKILLSVIVLFLILGGILIYMYYQKQQEEENEYFSIQEQRVERFFEYNTPQYKTITFTKRTISPTGRPRIQGFINNDKSLNFIAYVEPNNHNFEGSFGGTEKLRDMMNADLKNYSEIIREEKNER